MEPSPAPEPNRRRGRPPSREKTVPICFRVRVAVFDALFRKALRKDMTVAEFCRQKVESD